MLPRVSRPAEEHNLFDVIRLCLAAAVVYSHGTLLGGFGEEDFGRWVKGQTIAGSLGVLGFFGVSGFLVTRSFCTRGEAWDFVRSRILRILPGFYFALVLTAFVLAPLIAWTNAEAGEWTFSAAWQFVSRNAFLRVGEWHVGGVLHGLPYEESMNGALWSLFPEGLCYGLVLGLGVLGLLKGKRTGLYLFTALLAAMHIGQIVAPDQAELFAPTLLRLTGWTPFFLAFFVGACVYVARERFDLCWRGAIFWLLVAGVFLRFGGWKLAGPLVWPMFVIHLAYCGRLRLPGDISYGVYVLHFPIFHLLTAMKVNTWGYGWYLAAGASATVALATLSWLAIERPFLRMKRRVRKDDGETDGSAAAVPIGDARGKAGTLVGA